MPTKKPKSPEPADILIQKLRDTADSAGWVVTGHQVGADGEVVITLHLPPQSEEQPS
jgi:hypothetical protein